MTGDSWNRRQDLATLTGKTGTRIVPISPSTGEASWPVTCGSGRANRTPGPRRWIGRRPAERQRGGPDAQLPGRPGRGASPSPPRVLSLSAHGLKRAGASEGDLMALGGWTTSARVHRMANPPRSLERKIRGGGSRSATALRESSVSALVGPLAAGSGGLGGQSGVVGLAGALGPTLAFRFGQYPVGVDLVGEAVRGRRSSPPSIYPGRR
jgi:hypothetical protein